MKPRVSSPSTLSSSRKIAYSSGNLSVNLMAQAFATYIVFYYVDVLHVRPGLISIAMVIHGIFNAVLNPLFGYISDRTRSRWGRRFPYIALGVVPLAAAFTVIWFPLAPESGLFWYFLGMILLYDVLFVLVVLNYSALFPEMFTTIKDRAFVSSWRQMLGILGMIVGVAIPPMIYGSLGWEMMGVIFGIIVLIFFGVSLLGTKEDLAIQPGTYGLLRAIRYTFTNKAFVLFVIGSFLVQFTFALLPAGIPFFTKYVMGEGDTANTILLGAIFLSAIPLVYIWGKLLERHGPRKTVLMAVVCYAAALIPFSFVESLLWAAVTAACVGIGLAGLLVLLDVLLSEVIDEDERKTGERREGMYFGMNGFIVRWGVSLQAAVLGLILETSGYSADLAVQPDSAILGIRLMLSGLPLAVLLLSLWFFYKYPLGRGQHN